MHPLIAAAGLALAMFGAATARADDGPSAATVQTVMKSVVQVIATGCAGGGTGLGSGFIYHDSASVATALHVVAGCTDLRVYFERLPGQPYEPAHVVRVQSRLDLALLHLANPVPSLPLIETGNPPAHAELRAIGFIADQPSMEELPVSVSAGRAKLNDFLPATQARELQNTNPGIDLSNSIVRLASPLDPGMSGGPIIDAAGHVAAIGGGGLVNLPAPPSWGWPAGGLENLLASNESPTLVTSLPSQALHSFTSSGNAVTVLHCGELDLTLMGQRSFPALSPTADDPARLTYAVLASGLTAAAINSMEFDLWRNAASGAAILVPHGANLVQQQGSCAATSSDGIVKEVVYGQPVENQVALAAVSAQFERNVSAQYGMVLQQDLPLTTPGTIISQLRPDGLTLFNRKGAVMVRQTPFGPRLAHLFATMLARGQMFVGIMTIDDPYIPFPPQCNLQPAFPGCAEGSASLRKWAPFIISSQLSTFPAY